MISWAKGRFARVTDGVDIFPLVVLFTLFFFDEFDTSAFAVLAPNIQEYFHLTDRAFGLIVIGNLSVVLALAVPVGFYGDRLPRVFDRLGSLLEHLDLRQASERTGELR